MFIVVASPIRSHSISSFLPFHLTARHVTAKIPRKPLSHGHGLSSWLHVMWQQNLCVNKCKSSRKRLVYGFFKLLENCEVVIFRVVQNSQRRDKRIVRTLQRVYEKADIQFRCLCFWSPQNITKTYNKSLKRHYRNECIEKVLIQYYI